MEQEIQSQLKSEFADEPAAAAAAAAEAARWQHTEVNNGYSARYNVTDEQIR